MLTWLDLFCASSLRGGGLRADLALRGYPGRFLDQRSDREIMAVAMTAAVEQATGGMGGTMTQARLDGLPWFSSLEGYGEREALREAQAATQAAYMAKVANHV